MSPVGDVLVKYSFIVWLFFSSSSSLVRSLYSDFYNKVAKQPQKMIFPPFVCVEIRISSGSGAAHCPGARQGAHAASSSAWLRHYGRVVTWRYASTVGNQTIGQTTFWCIMEQFLLQQSQLTSKDENGFHQISSPPSFADAEIVKSQERHVLWYRFKSADLISQTVTVELLWWIERDVFESWTGYGIGFSVTLKGMFCYLTTCSWISIL